LNIMLNETMKTNYLTAFFLVVVLISGCENEVDPGIPMDREPKNFDVKDENFDFNDDGINDFSLKYNAFAWCGIKESGMGISARLSAAGRNAVLQTSLSECLFSKQGDIINRNITEPLEWDGFYAPLANYYQMISNTEDEWTVYSENSPDSYYLGIKIEKETEVLIGWVKLGIDIKTGHVKVLEKKTTSDASIVVGR
jgi:hypothetical protein